MFLLTTSVRFFPLVRKLHKLILGEINSVYRNRDDTYNIEGVDNGSGELQLNIKDGVNTVQEIELAGVNTGGDAAATLQTLLDSGAIDDGSI